MFTGRHRSDASQQSDETRNGFHSLNRGEIGNKLHSFNRNKPGTGFVPRTGNYNKTGYYFFNRNTIGIDFVPLSIDCKRHYILSTGNIWRLCRKCWRKSPRYVCIKIAALDIDASCETKFFRRSLTSKNHTKVYYLSGHISISFKYKDRKGHIFVLFLY